MGEPDKKESRVVHKRRLGIFVVALIVVVLLALAYFFSEGTDDGKLTVVAAVRGYLSVEQKDALTMQLTGYAPDIEEGGAPVTLVTYEFPATGGGDTAKMLGELSGALSEGDADLVLLDSYVYDLLGNDTLFEDLSARYPDDPAVVGRYRYAISGKPFANAEGLEELPTLYFVLRSAESSAVNRNAQTLDDYDVRRHLLDNVANSTPPSSYAAQGLVGRDEEA